MIIFFYFLKGFYWKEFFGPSSTVPVIHLIRCSFSSLTYSLEAQFFRLFFLFPEGVLLNERFFENHNYRTSQNISQRRKRAPDQAYTMMSTVVMIVLKICFQ